MKLYYDLHIHSALSPCADDDMTPNNIVGMSKLKGLDIIAVADHNSTLNLEAIAEVAKQMEIIHIPAMELETSEEFHMLCLFPDMERAMEFGDFVYSRLPKVENKETVFGPQHIYDCEDNIIGIEKMLLSGATSISVYDAVKHLREIGALAIPAHIDRPSYSIISNLGMIPPDLDFKTVEIYNTQKTDELKKVHPYIEKCKIISDSDAHNLGLISEKVNFLDISHANIGEILRKLN